MSSTDKLACSVQRVTAVRLVEELKTKGSLHLFIGSGSKVEIQEFTADVWISVYHRVVLAGSVIYGFRTGPGKRIAIFGQKAVAIYKFDEDKVFRQLSPLRVLDDWIRDLIWLDNGEEYAVITAHNQLLIIYSSTGQVIRSHLSGINCILYSAKLLCACNGGTPGVTEDIAVVAGTVFNTVILWSCDTLVDNKSPVLHSLSGHKGVIFDIDVDLQAQRLCSVSDDRSIRLWHWEYECEKAKRWSNTKFELLNVFNGHTCRVWSAVLLHSTHLISIGEDGFVIVWGLDGSVKRRIKSHKSGSVWCLSVNGGHMVTAGANASVWMWPLESLLEENIEEISARSPVTLIEPPDFPRVVCIEGLSCFILTDKGYLYGYNLVEHSEHMLSEDTRWSLVETTPIPSGNTIVALGNATGLVRLIVTDNNLCVRGSVEFVTSASKLVKLDWVKSVHELLVSASNGSSFLYKVGLEDSSEVSVSAYGCYLLPRQKQWFVACACHITSPSGYDYMVLADMDGSVHLYRTEVDSTDSTGQSADFTLPRIHGKKGLTDMYSREDTLHTIGRDGYHYKYTVTSNELVKVESVKISKEFSWLAKFISDENSLRVVAFHTTELLLYDVTLNYVVMRVNCGGGHRSWDFVQQLDDFYVAFIKAKSVQMYRKSFNSSFLELLPGFHTGKVTCCALLTNTSRTILITGGDDGSIIGSDIRQQTSPSDSSCIPATHRESTHLYSHISSVRCMCYTSSLSKSQNLLVFSGGGRAQLVASKISAEDKLKTLNVCTAHLSRLSRVKKDRMSADMRIMAISTVAMDSCQHLLCIACSDGSIRTALYNEEREKLYVALYKLYEHSHCLLTTYITSISADLALLTVGATDGSIILLHISPAAISRHVLEGDPPLALPHGAARSVMTVRSHQSGVNAVCVRQSGDRVTLYSGGDDNSMVITDLDLGEKEVLSMQKYSRQHSAQITGVRLLGDRLLSCSVDQRLHVWSRQQDTEEWKVTDTKFMDVADVACIHSCGDTVVVAGEGVEILQNL